MEKGLAKRSITLDVVKGVCIILMVIGHSGAPSWLVAFIYTFHMPCFFIVSGMLFKEKYIQGITTFVKRRLMTLYWPFIKWSLIFMALHNVFTALYIYTTTYSPGEYGHHVVRILTMTSSEQLLGGFWFLKALLISSLLSALYFRGGFSTVRIAIGLIAVVSLTWVLLKFAPRLTSFGHVYLLAVAFFFAGTLIVRLPKLSWKRATPVIVIISLVIVTVSTLYPVGTMTGCTYHTVIQYFIVATLTSYALILLFSMAPSGKPMKVLAYVGARSIDILIWHFLAFKIVAYLHVACLGAPKAAMSAFPVYIMPEQNLWMLYAIVGIVVPILLRMTYQKIRHGHWV